MHNTMVLLHYIIFSYQMLLSSLCSSLAIIYIPMKFPLNFIGSGL